MPRKVAVVPHTHWDREWYGSYQTFRLRLIHLLDQLLPGLDGHPSYTRFLLDGQMAVIDDYLAARPEAEPALRRLAGAGRLAMGPWYILMDEFCVSGETIVRNLQLGLDRATSYGGAMPVGYLPDMFGHIGQMPQVLREAGLDHAVVWRGVPAAINRSGFWWRAPDGSTVRAEYLPVGYGNGAYLPDDPDALVRRLRAHQAELRRYLPTEADPILLMTGTDHQIPQLGLPDLLAEANDRQKDFEFELQSLAEYLAGAPTEALPAWSGELRSGARANLLMGVLSNRVDIKAAAATTERALERVAEPLAALWLPVEHWPARLLADAWIEVIRNSAHDSICACSADEVGQAVLHRYAEATAIARGVADEALGVASLAMAGTGPVVVNPGPRPASGVVELDVPGVEPIAGAQQLHVTAAASLERVGVGGDLGRILAELTEEGWLANGRSRSAAVSWSPEGVDLDLEVDTARPPDPSLSSVMAEAYAQAGANRDGPLRVRLRRAPSQRIAVRVEDVPGYGWKHWEPGPAEPTSVEPTGASPAAASPGAVNAGANWLDNGLVHLAVNPADGTFAVNGLSGLDRLVDSGDAGDTYNYSPPAGDIVIDRPVAVRIELIERGPVRGRLRVLRQFRWPAYVWEGCRVGEEQVEVITDLELRAGESLIRVSAHFDNRCRDHRLRTLFPLPQRTDRSVAECAFATVTRGLEAEGGPHERAVPTFPSRRFVTAGGLTLTHEGLLEYELVDGGWTLALTLLRATGMLSRPAPAFRPNAAGPADPLEGPQMVGPVAVRYAVAVEGSATTADGSAGPWGYEVADQAWLPLRVVRGAGTGPLGPVGSHLQVRGAEVSALQREAGGLLELRVFNPTDNASLVNVEGRSGWLVDLRGQPRERWQGSFVLRAWGFATALLDP